jgi:hypothetical protein
LPAVFDAGQQSKIWLKNPEVADLQELQRQMEVGMVIADYPV